MSSVIKNDHVTAYVPSRILPHTHVRSVNYRPLTSNYHSGLVLD
jgi:hypothetical protein